MSACATSSHGSPAPARRRSTTSWKTRPPRRSHARSCGSGYRHGRSATNGLSIDRATVAQLIDEGMSEIAAEKASAFDMARFADARKIFEHVALADDFDDFLTLPAYELLD